MLTKNVLNLIEGPPQRGPIDSMATNILNISKVYIILNHAISYKWYQRLPKYLKSTKNTNNQKK